MAKKGIMALNSYYSNAIAAFVKEDPEQRF
jgi:hypothetical protein